MRKIDVDDVADIGRGAAILGTGGGGDPQSGSLLATAALREYGPVQVLGLDDVEDSAWALPVAIIGAPTIMLEKLPTIGQVVAAVQQLAEYASRTPTHVLCAEAGGVNSLIPVAAAAALGLPLVDADAMGRAFPEIDQGLPALGGVMVTPAAVTDEKGNGVVVDTVDNHWAERLARAAAIEMGCAAAISAAAMNGRQVRELMVPGTLSLCAELGRLTGPNRPGHEDPVAAVARRLSGKVVFTGKVVDVDRRTEKGFARGVARIAGLDADEGSETVVRFQNEFLVAERDGTAMVSTPDLICILDSATGAGVRAEILRYGQRVSVLAAPADPRWHTPEGHALAGPRAFGYDADPVRV
ncbi:DUF917 domain-containing protein [Amycolatopsis jejuensis]|uniref:DUF917 domain-containing protein n=1 Tax=Amycolatopsis jejuensis TaxID=330084 RepID=UPI000526204B|nr:DUF917 domain-containing protein [Amycolatopsis jejuensis]